MITLPVAVFVAPSVTVYVTCTRPKNEADGGV